jgi:hypothetical protein
LKIPKTELKRQNELLALLKSDKKLTEDQIEQIYEEWNPAVIDSISMNGVYFTPNGLCRDVVAMAQVRGHVVEIAAGIGGLAYWAKQYDTYPQRVKSITCIEINPQFVEIGKRLLPEAPQTRKLPDHNRMHFIFFEKSQELFKLITVTRPRRTCDFFFKDIQDFKLVGFAVTLQVVDLTFVVLILCGYPRIDHGVHMSFILAYFPTNLVPHAT